MALIIYSQVDGKRPDEPLVRLRVDKLRKERKCLLIVVFDRLTMLEYLLEKLRLSHVSL